MEFSAKSGKRRTFSPRDRTGESGSDRAPSLPRVLLVGGPDVRARGDLMKALVGRFEISAAGSEPRDAEYMAKMGFPFHYFPMRRGSSPASDLRTCLALFHICRGVRPDIVHTFATKPCVWGRVAARLAGVPIVIGTLPGLGSLYSANGLKRQALKRIYESLQRSASHVSDLTIFQNERDAGELTEAGVVPEKRAVVIPGSGVRTDLLDRDRVSPEAVRRLRSDLGMSDRTVLVTMISRVIRSKGVLVFAEAARRVREAAEGEVRFLLVGPNDRQSVDCLTNEELAYLSASVTWLGERRDIRRILATTDVFALPTFYREGIPRVLLEAASMSLPLIATARPGCEEVIAHGRNGFLVPPRDAAALARSVLTLVEDPSLRKRYGQDSRRIAVEQFDLKVIARRTARLYQELLDKQVDARSRDGWAHTVIEVPGRSTEGHTARPAASRGYAERQLSASSPSVRPGQTYD